MNAQLSRALLSRALRMEWTRLRTIRSTWLMAGLCLLSSGGLGLAVAIYDQDEAPVMNAASVINPGQPAPTAILLGLLGVLAWGHDYRYGTIRPLLTVQPRRGVLAGARVLVFTAFLSAVATAAVALACLAGILGTGGGMTEYFGQSPLPRMMIGSVLFGVGCGLLGMALGALVRALPAAIALLIAVPAMVEPLAGMVLGKIHENAEVWLPFYAVGQMVWPDPLPAGPPPAVGALIFLAATSAALAAGIAAFIRRDA